MSHLRSHRHLRACLHDFNWHVQRFQALQPEPTVAAPDTPVLAIMDGAVEAATVEPPAAEAAEAAETLYVPTAYRGWYREAGDGEGGVPLSALLATSRARHACGEVPPAPAPSPFSPPAPPAPAPVAPPAPAPVAPAPVAERPPAPPALAPVAEWPPAAPAPSVFVAEWPPAPPAPLPPPPPPTRNDAEEEEEEEEEEEDEDDILREWQPTADRRAGRRAARLAGGPRPPLFPPPPPPAPAGHWTWFDQY